MKKHFLFCVLLVATLLCGCNELVPPETPTKDTLLVAEDKTITEYLVDEFEEPYYSVKELEEMAKAEASSYNLLHKATGVSQVVVESAEEYEGGAGRKVRLKTVYTSANTFADYTEQVFFFGTGLEAAYLIGDEIANKYSENPVIVTDAAAVIYGYKKVEAVYGGYPILEDGGVDLTQIAEGNKAIIVLKK